eukprot:scaffold603_cov404-Prasinococcus_capsulatus_cf.AAC.20
MPSRQVGATGLFPSHLELPTKSRTRTVANVWPMTLLCTQTPWTRVRGRHLRTRLRSTTESVALWPTWLPSPLCVCVARMVIVFPGSLFDRVAHSGSLRAFLVETALANVSKHRQLSLETRGSILPRTRYIGPKDGPQVVSVPHKRIADEPGHSIDHNSSRASTFKFERRGSGKPRRAHPLQDVQREVEPEYDLMYQGYRDFQNAWKDSRVNHHSVETTEPSSLILRVQLPKLSSAAGVDLDVTPRMVSLRKKGLYKLEVGLPCTVEDTKGQAKFDKDSHILEVILPMRPPPPEPPRPFIEPEPEQEQCDDEEESTVTHDQEAHAAEGQDEDKRDKIYTSSQAEVETVQDGCPMQETGAHYEPESVPGNEAQRRDGLATLPQESQDKSGSNDLLATGLPTPAVQLRPRLTCSAAFELH